MPQIVRTAGAAGSESGVVFGGAIAHPAVTACTQEFLCSNPVNQGIYSFTRMLGDGAVGDSTSTTTPGGGYGG